MFWHGFNYTGVFGGWMIVFWILLIVALLFGAFRMRRWHRGWGCRYPYAGRRDEKDAVDIARERYARGEITEEEFKKITKTLS
jgi:putative membrane protein